MFDVPSTATRRGVGIRYIPGLDGLRALAVAAVFFYHVDPNILPGGFLGVEVFFVISGYLITTLLLGEWQTHGTIDLPRFWLRRARRLLPAVIVFIAGTLTFARLVLPDELAGLRGDALSSLFYVQNWYFILVQKPYFEAIGRPSLFQHLWSLAVEEQFYILFPLALVWLLRRITLRRVLVLALVGAALSAVLMMLLYQPEVDPSRVYYGTDTRAAGLLLGVTLAILLKPNAKQHTLERHPRITDALGLASLGGVALAFFTLNEYDPFLYLGGFTLVALLTCVVIIAVIVPTGRLDALLGGRLLRWGGTRSYSLYLWHYPVLLVTRPQLDVPIDGPVLFFVRLVITLLLAEASYRWVESPIRNGALERAWRVLADREDRRKAVRLSWVAAFGVLALFSVALSESAASAQAPTPLALAAGAGAGADWTDSLQVGDPTSTPLPSETPTPAPVVPSIAPTSTAAPKQVSPPVTPSTVVTASNSILAVGDSVMLGATGELKRAIPQVQVDAIVGRQVSAGPNVLRSHLGSAKFDTVIVHLGDNGPVSAKQFDELMKSLVSIRRVIVVNTTVPRAWQGPNNTVIAQGIKRYPNAVLADWNAASSEHADYFWKDGVHLRPAGAKAYVALIAGYINTR